MVLEQSLVYLNHSEILVVRSQSEKDGRGVAQGWIITTREGIVGGIVFYVTKIKAGGEE